MKTKERLVECSFLIPVLRNSDQQPHQPVDWRNFQNELLSLSPDKAFTGPETALVFRKKKKVPGKWKEIDDESRKYTVAIPVKQLKGLRKVLCAQCDRFDQESIYLSVAGKVELIRRGKSTP